MAQILIIVISSVKHLIPDSTPNVIIGGDYNVTDTEVFYKFKLSDDSI